jgi:DNA-binding CsgD family transcriptional regulator
VKLLAALEKELGTLHLDRPSAIDEVLPSLQEFVETENLLVVTPVERAAGGLTIERYHARGFADTARVQARFEQFFHRSPRRYAWYDPTCPEPEQRNAFIDALDLMPSDEFERSSIYAQVLKPLDLHRKRQPRMLLCDGPSLLAWFGSFSSERATARQRKLFQRIAPKLRERLAVERRLTQLPRTYAALEQCLERLGAPAFVAAANGAIVETNASGRALLEARGKETRAALADCLRGRPSTIAFELTQLEHAGAATGWLAIVPARTDDERIATAVETAALRWELTPRQREVLGHLVSGTPNTTIAAMLRVSVRAVEMHVTKLLERAGVESRAALVGRVLLG